MVTRSRSRSEIPLVVDQSLYFVSICRHVSLYFVDNLVMTENYHRDPQVTGLINGFLSVVKTSGNLSIPLGYKCDFQYFGFQ